LSSLGLLTAVLTDDDIDEQDQDQPA
jgi:hypothetical protein